MWAMAPLFRAMGPTSYLTLALTGTYTATSNASTAYSSDLTISGGNGVYSNPQVASGSLPTGLSLSVVGNKLRLSGTTGTINTTYTFTVSVDSGDGQTATSSSQSVTIAATDPNWASVQSLLYFAGANGSTTFTDEVSGTTWARTGTAAISTAQAKFGTSSGLFPAGTIDSSGITASAGTKWSFPGDFTVEAFIYPITGAPSNQACCIFQAGNSSTNNTGGLSFALQNYQLRVSAAFVANYIQGAITLSQNTWHYVGVKRSGTTLSTWVDGTMDKSVTNSATFSPSNGASIKGYVGGGNLADTTSVYPLPGYIGILRVTKGVARDLSIVPTAPFPNH